MKLIIDSSIHVLPKQGLQFSVLFFNQRYLLRCLESLGKKSVIMFHSLVYSLFVSSVKAKRSIYVLKTSFPYRPCSIAFFIDYIGHSVPIVFLKIGGIVAIVGEHI